MARGAGGNVGTSWRETWAELKQLGWVILLLWALIAVLGLLSHDYFGKDTVPVMLGLAALVAVVLGSIAAASILASLVADLLRRLREMRKHDGGKPGS